MAISVIPIYQNLRYIVILWCTETYDMAITSISLHYNYTKTILVVLKELNMVEFPSKQLRIYRIPVHNRKHFSLFKVYFL